MYQMPGMRAIAKTRVFVHTSSFTFPPTSRLSGVTLAMKKLADIFGVFLRDIRFQAKISSKALDLGVALTGDYLIRCNGGSVIVFDIEIKSDKVFSTKRIREL